MKPLKIVIDTNVIVSGLRSSLGASYKLLSLVGDERFECCLSVALVLEYESAIKRAATGIKLSAEEKDQVLDFLCASGRHQKVHFLWRPQLKDPGDDMVLELAVAAGAEAIVTFNRSDFKGSEKFGIKIVSPQEFLGRLGGRS
jgi:putative PIN family toxin of toxin-antitoxin system